MVTDVVAPSRLHFGLFSFGQPRGRQFGGVGVMIDQPGLHVRVAPAETFTVSGPLAQRARATIARLCEARGWQGPPACQVQIVTAPPQHQGLGTGTQFDLAVASALHAWLGNGALSAEQLAAWTGRGERSAVGTYGFVSGGLIVEDGKHANQRLSPLRCRIELPADWRWLVLFPDSPAGLAGAAERAAFRQLPAVSPATTAALLEEVEQHLQPAAAAGDFAPFGQSVYRFGRLAGECFSASQGGAFAGGRVTELVEQLRSLGVAGVGQSSWGPAVFALFEHESAAQHTVEQIGSLLRPGESWLITRSNNQGATIRTSSKP